MHETILNYLSRYRLIHWLSRKQKIHIAVIHKYDVHTSSPDAKRKCSILRSSSLCVPHEVVLLLLLSLSKKCIKCKIKKFELTLTDHTRVYSAKNHVVRKRDADIKSPKWENKYKLSKGKTTINKWDNIRKIIAVILRERGVWSVEHMQSI